MGLIRSVFHFTVGALVGIYVAQNYDLPNVNSFVNTGSTTAKHFEEQHRKPSKPDEKS